ncbi:hypothetical protein ACF1AE_17820 [Streptomyces sp. NPDC014986]|uniref:DUF6414 family protein n=1 Tax=Streptomyces sp. NPDC014986 TaxID=3364934 RepID=UPI00370048AD
MLKRFMYLDTNALADYVSALEDGVRSSLERQDEGERATFSDTPQAQFERLLSLANSEPDLAGWFPVESDTALSEIRVGHLIDAECDIYIPDLVKALSPQGGLIDALNRIESIMPAMSIFGADGMDDLPSREQRDAVKLFSNALGGSQIAVGELDESAWHLAGQLAPEYVKSDVEGRARLIGKVSNIWQAGQWKPLLALPGTSLIPRADRRKMERKRPAENEREHYLEGPAVMLDVLAIYR